MTSIAKLMKEYSAESAELDVAHGADSEGIDPVEELEEIAELEEVADDESGAILEDEGDGLETAVHTLVEAHESLESSLDYLESVRDQHGEISDLGLRLFHAGVQDSMEARGIPFEVLTGGAVFSMENSDKASTEEAKKGFFKRIWEMIKAAFQRMREWITRFFSWFRTSGKAVKAAAEKLKKVATEKKAAGAKAEGKKYNQRPFTDLMVGGAVDPAKSMTVLATAAKEAFASAGHLIDTSLSAIDVIKKASEGPKKEAGFFAKLFGKTIEDTKRAYIKELSAVMSKQSLVNLPGSRVLETKVEPTKKGFRAKVKMVKPDKALITDDRWAPVMSLDAIIATADSIIRLVDGTDKMVELFDKKFEQTKGFDSFMPKDENTGAGEIRDLAAMISQGTAAGRAIVSELSSHIFPIAKRAYAAGLINVRQYK